MSGPSFGRYGSYPLDIFPTFLADGTLSTPILGGFDPSAQAGVPKPRDKDRGPLPVFEIIFKNPRTNGSDPVWPIVAWGFRQPVPQNGGVYDQETAEAPSIYDQALNIFGPVDPFDLRRLQPEYVATLGLDEVPTQQIGAILFKEL